MTDIRQTRARHFWGESDGAPTAADDTLVARRSADRRHLHTCVDQLSASDRMMVALYCEAGLNFDEIARVLDINESRAHRDLIQALNRLRDLIATA